MNVRQQLDGSEPCCSERPAAARSETRRSHLAPVEVSLEAGPEEARGHVTAETDRTLPRQTLPEYIAIKGLA